MITDPKELLLSVLHAKDASRDRSTQTQVGPSEIGGCRRKVWYRLNSQPHTNDNQSKLAAIMGTAIHAAIEDAIQHLDPEGKDYLVESEVAHGDMKAAPKPSAKPAQAPPKELPGFEKESTVSPFEADVKKQGITIPSNYTQTHKLWMDLLLFISSGLLFIFLLEQLYKIALMSGMKKTIQAMDSLIRLKESST